MGKLLPAEFHNGTCTQKTMENNNTGRRKMEHWDKHKTVNNKDMHKTDKNTACKTDNTDMDDNNTNNGV